MSETHEPQKVRPQSWKARAIDAVTGQHPNMLLVVIVLLMVPMLVQQISKNDERRELALKAWIDKRDAETRQWVEAIAKDNQKLQFMQIQADNIKHSETLKFCRELAGLKQGDSK